MWPFCFAFKFEIQMESRGKGRKPTSPTMRKSRHSPDVKNTHSTVKCFIIICLFVYTLYFIVPMSCVCGPRYPFLCGGSSIFSFYFFKILQRLHHTRPLVSFNSNYTSIQTKTVKDSFFFLKKQKLVHQKLTFCY